jgi:hypothetical protein
MRRLTLSVLALLAAGAVLAGCGSSSPAGAPANPLASSLSYVPAQTPFAMTVATKPSASAAAQEKQLNQRLQAQLPVASLGGAALLAQLQKKYGINVTTDIKPLEGNPIVFADASPSLPAFASSFLIVWVTNSADKLSSLVGKLKGLSPAGSHDGAKLYSSSGAALAVSGPTLLFAKTPAIITAALDRHAHGGGLTASQYATDVQGLSSDASLHLFGDLAGALATPKAATARRIPWVAALRSYGATFGYDSSGLTIQFRLSTGGVSLSPSQLPFAGGTASPSVVPGFPIQVGLRDPAQIASFAESAAQAASAVSYAKFLRQLATIKRKTGVDLNDLVNQFRGNLIVISDTRQTFVRAGIANPSTVTKLLSRMAAAKTGFGSHSPLRPLGGGFYAVTSATKSTTVGVAAGQLLVGEVSLPGNEPPAALRRFAAAPTAPVSGASGALSFRVSLTQLIALRAAQNPAAQSPIARQLLSLLGDFSGSMAVTPSALTGTGTLAIK